MPLRNAAPIQTKLFGHCWQVLNPSKIVVGHYRTAKAALETAELYHGYTVQFVGAA
jgi:hypothetical protein